MDPFGATCDPRAYVPRPASELALEQLDRGVRSGCGATVLSGPTGIGKTQLLRVLEARLAPSLGIAHVPYAALEGDDLARFALGVLGRDPLEPPDPEAEIGRIARHGALLGRPLLLVLDDASAWPLEDARRWAAHAAESRGALRLLVVPLDDARAGRVVAALGDELAHVRYVEPLSRAETTAYVAARLAYAEAPRALRERLAGPTLDWLHRESLGNPRRLHVLASWILHRSEPAPGTWAPAREQEELWLEADLDEADALLEVDSGAPSGPTSALRPPVDSPPSAG